MLLAVRASARRAAVGARVSQRRALSEIQRRGGIAHAAAPLPYYRRKAIEVLIDAGRILAVIEQVDFTNLYAARRTIQNSCPETSGQGCSGNRAGRLADERNAYGSLEL